jgi:hypothetical protein
MCVVKERTDDECTVTELVDKSEASLDIQHKVMTNDVFMLLDTPFTEMLKMRPSSSMCLLQSFACSACNGCACWCAALPTDEDRQHFENAVRDQLTVRSNNMLSEDVAYCMQHLSCGRDAKFGVMDTHELWDASCHCVDTTPDKFATKFSALWKSCNVVIVGLCDNRHYAFIAFFPKSAHTELGMHVETFPTEVTAFMFLLIHAVRDRVRSAGALFGMEHVPAFPVCCCRRWKVSVSRNRVSVMHSSPINAMTGYVDP